MSFSLPDALSILTATHNWVAWRLENVQGRDKPVKMPYNPNTGERAKPNDNSTWSSFDMATALAKKFNGGIGFMFSEGCGYCGIDLDDVMLSDGTLKPFAKDIVDALNSYTEFSPSGKGLHILCMLKKPLSEFGTRRKNPELKIEIYDDKRYLTVTGNVYGDEKPIIDCTQILKDIYPRYWEIKQTKQDSRIQWDYNPKPYQDTLPPQQLTDSQLLERMFNSQHGHEIKQLYEGNIDGYQSQSEAELALCNHLAFWTDKDTGRIDSLFRHSGLMRTKWDEKHGNQTYGQMTIDKAINSASTRNVNVSWDNLPSQNQNNVTGHSTTVTDNSENTHSEIIQVASFDAYLKNNFQSDIQNFTAFSECTTGFKNLDDDNVRLYPGLYTIGGVSSVGKTTFCSQLADNIAKRGGFVIYFTLEQSKFELASKGITRIIRQQTSSEYVTSLRIRNGFTDAYVQRAMQEYMNIAAHEVILDGQFNFSVLDIARIVEQFITNTGERPAVFVDYLQTIKPADINIGTKEAVDFNVQTLKKLSNNFNLPVFVISSFNRTNYLNIADFEAFKESGSIEYTADVVLALQLLAMNADIFDKQSNLQTKRKFVRAAKKANPRKIELLCLKNRFGKANERYFFNYYPASEFFEPYLITEDEADDKVQADFDAFNSQQEYEAISSKKSSKKKKDDRI